MPDNQIPATQSESGAAPGELNFAEPAPDNPRIRRRSLKAKSGGGGLIKPTGPLPAARELEREAPPLSPEQVIKPRVQEKAVEVKTAPPGKVTETPLAPPRTTPSPSRATTPSQPAPAPATPAQPVPVATTPAQNTVTTASGATAPKIATTVTPTSSSTTTISPHGTRPATLYYSSPTKKAESPSPMKTTPTASPTASSSATVLPQSTTRPSSASVAPRPATTVDYRANVERQSREQKSVGSILSYVVYTLIAFFVISVGLAGYGSYVIFQKLHDQSQTVSDLDARYAAANKDLTAKLAATQDTLTQAQAQITRQQDLLVKQQEDINHLISATSDNATALKQERQTRAQETANLRGRVRELEDKTATPKL